MMQKNSILKANTKKFIIDLVNAGLVGESKLVELAAISLARSIKKDEPDVSANINRAISTFSINGGAPIRSIEHPIPIDNETQLDMATLISPDTESNLPPILPHGIDDRVKGFLDERDKMELLLDMDIRPSTSMLLIGQPGTGKTMLAKYIASALKKNLIILDLSTSISSLMGKTGSNLKKVLQYAKQNPCVLLFDEFDAIAKKRDDNTDLGEIKRVVNILLMELEDWPISSMFIATSNHPELLDKAIWRRFDHVISIPQPEKKERLEILQKELGGFLKKTDTAIKILEPISEFLVDKSAADICKYVNNAKRRSVLRKEEPIISLFRELQGFDQNKKVRAKFCILAKEILGDKITIREIAQITGLSVAGVQHHIKKSKS